jgi:general secretion pathway protein G
MAGNRRSAFSSAEILVLVIVVVILAAAIVPHFVSSPAVVDDGLLRFNLHAIRAQIEEYKTDHADKAPSMATFCDQMTKSTNTAGATTCGKLALGPYFEGQIPVNPFNNSRTVVAVATPGRPPITAVPGDAGWQYDETTGRMYPNNPEYFVR